MPLPLPEDLREFSSKCLVPFIFSSTNADPKTNIIFKTVDLNPWPQLQQTESFRFGPWINSRFNHWECLTKIACKHYSGGLPVGSAGPADIDLDPKTRGSAHTHTSHQTPNRAIILSNPKRSTIHHQPINRLTGIRIYQSSTTQSTTQATQKATQRTDAPATQVPNATLNCSTGRPQGSQGYSGNNCLALVNFVKHVVPGPRKAPIEHNKIPQDGHIGALVHFSLD
ncbi:hypothetical protein PGTUg99_025848 [Puccinia graminis f. sp. tritici]|uniref:Uncharacterized protein n=1 Tax=Puccinia graminis f. sp. tritici TaxID=56615 RepID=A0A5B0R811_PUCGR|nr:hypothetical protein PGTUg99_025848 [Puccinia graminis f. sp. tritici]